MQEVEKGKKINLHIRYYDEFENELYLNYFNEKKENALIVDSDYIKFEAQVPRGYTYTGYTYGINSMTDFSYMINEKIIEIKLPENAEEVYVDLYCQEMVDAEISTVISKNKRVGGNVITTVKVKNNSGIHIYSAIVYLNVNGKTYEANVDIGPKASSNVKFYWQAPDAPGLIPAWVKLELSGYYAEDAGGDEDNIKNFDIRIY